MLEGHECLLETGDRLAVGRSREGLGAGLTEVAHRLLPDLASECVVCERLEVLDQAVGIELLDRVDDLGVQGPASIEEQTPVRHVVDQRVFEGVLEIREQTSLVEKLPVSRWVRPVCSASSGPSAMAWSRLNGTSLPMTAAACRSRLSSSESRSIREARIACAVAGI